MSYAESSLDAMTIVLALMVFVAFLVIASSKKGEG